MPKILQVLQFLHDAICNINEVQPHNAKLLRDLHACELVSQVHRIHLIDDC